MQTISTTQHDSFSGLHDLMMQYVDGDQTAFRRLHARLGPSLRTRLRKLVRDEAGLDDLLQLTFLRAHQARHRFEAQTRDRDLAVQAWYLAIARNVALDHLRQWYRRERRHDKLARQVGDESAAVPKPDRSAEDVEIDREQAHEAARAINWAIDQLPPGQAEVIRLHKLRGLSMADVAARLDARPGAIRVRAHRAYKALSRILAGTDAPIGHRAASGSCGA